MFSLELISGNRDGQGKTWFGLLIINIFDFQKENISDIIMRLGSHLEILVTNIINQFELQII